MTINLMQTGIEQSLRTSYTCQLHLKKQSMSNIIAVNESKNSYKSLENHA